MAEPLGEEDFDAASGIGRVVLGVEAGAGGVEARGENAGVVEDEEVSLVEMAGEVGEGLIRVGTGVAIHDEHAAGAADRGWGLGDELFGEIEVEVGDAHWFDFSSVAID